MAKVRIGTLVSTGAAVNLDLGFRPSRIIVQNYTNYATPANGEILNAEWFDGMLDAYAFINTFDNTGGALGVLPTLATSNGFTPYVTGDASLFTSTLKTITGITAVSRAVVTSVAHGMAVGDVVTFSNVVGMTEINRLRGTILTVPTADTFSVNIDSSAFTAYASGGLANWLTTTVVNDGETGITLGTSVVGASADVLYYIAMLDQPIN